MSSKKYRIVELAQHSKTHYAIQKQWKFLWWSGWNIVKLISGDSHYFDSKYAIYDTLEEANEYICKQYPIQIKVIREVDI